jgi:diguanylate cyclase (GGDEF)-like protein
MGSPASRSSDDAGDLVTDRRPRRDEPAPFAGARPTTVRGAGPVRSSEVAGAPPEAIGAPTEDRRDRLVRRTSIAFGVIFVAFVIAAGIEVATGQASAIDAITIGLTLALGAVAVINRTAVSARERDRMEEMQDTALMMQSLSRAVSPDAVVSAIADELGNATSADHVVVVRRRPHAWALDATLVSVNAGTPPSTTTLPSTDLIASHATSPGRGREAIPVGATARASGSGARPPRPGVARGDGYATEADLASVKRLESRVADAFGLSHTIAAPLEVDAGLVGAIVLSRRTAVPWTDAARRRLVVSAAEASAALERLYSLSDAETRALTDPLTGLPNRRRFDEHLASMGRRRRAGDRVGVLMIDLDHFKVVNDTCGHAAGDRMLVAVGRAIAGSVRDADLPARLGGEEFAVVLRDPLPERAIEVAERVRAAIAAIDFRADGIPVVTASVGVAVSADAGLSVEAVVERADEALLRAKRTGRDRVEVA